MRETNLIESFHSLAESAVFRLVERSKVDLELQEAFQTVKLGKDAVRIGDFDISVAPTGDGIRVFNISSKKNGNIVLADVAFYETARKIVFLLNKGASPQSLVIRRIMRWNDQLVRLKADESVYEQIINETKNEERAIHAENRLGNVQAKIQCLQSNLLNINVEYF